MKRTIIVLSLVGLAVWAATAQARPMPGPKTYKAQPHPSYLDARK